MKTSAYVIGSVEMMIGIVMLSVTSVIKEVMPVLGRVAYQAAAAGSYSARDYAVNFPFVTAAAILFIAAGVLQMVYFGVMKKQ